MQLSCFDRSRPAVYTALHCIIYAASRSGHALAENTVLIEIALLGPLSVHRQETIMVELKNNRLVMHELMKNPSVT